MTCPHNDSGWCYAPQSKHTNAVQGACSSPSTCPDNTNYTTLERIRDAEADGMTLTLEPGELTEIMDEVRQWTREYAKAAAHRDQVRVVARQALIPLRREGYESFCVELEDALWGK